MSTALNQFLLSLSPSCVTRKKTARKNQWPREILGVGLAQLDLVKEGLLDLLVVIMFKH